MIILNQDQAESLEFTTRNDKKPLKPRKLKDGSYALPLSVLTDPDCQHKRDYLEGMRRRPVADDEFESSDDK